MTIAAAILGGIAGFAIGVLFTEVIFSNSQSWPDVVPFALAVLACSPVLPWAPSQPSTLTSASR